MATTAEAVARQYEIMFIVAGNKTDDTVKEVHQTVKDEITSRGGKVLHEDLWGKREFAYPIRRLENGYYTVMQFDMPGTKVNDLGKHLRLNTNVLRFLVTQVPPDYKFLPYAAIMEKGRRAEKGARGRSRESDSIAAEGKSLQKGTPVRRSTATRSTAAPRPSTSPSITAPAPVAPPAPIPAPKVEKAKPILSEEDRLKELDQELAKLMKDDQI